jgi:predicted Zn-dependent peptidase
LQDQTPLLEQGMDFFSEVLFAPVLEEGHFQSSYVDVEKQILQQRLSSLQDDKIRYASKRLNEEMCQGEPFALYAYGGLADLAALDATKLYTYYQEMFRTCPIDLYCIGQVDIDALSKLIEQHFVSRLAKNERQNNLHQAQAKMLTEERVIVERMDVKQGKLNIGCRTQLTIEDEAYPALMLYNGILGGFAHSKLFMNVREKASLAYYCSSRLESHKGLLSIQSGVEIENYERALSIIREQLAAMQQGNITEQELEKTKATLINQFRERQDSAYGMIDLHHHSNVSARKWSLEELLTRLAETSREQVQQVAQQVQIDTIYFLRDQGGENDAKA